VKLPAYPRYKPSGVRWLHEVPEHWGVGPVKLHISRVESGTSVNASDAPAENGELGVLKTSCVYSGSFRPEENKTVLETDFERVSCPLKAGTLIVSRMNTPELIGAAGVVTTAPGNLFLPDRLWQISFKKADVRFVHFWTLTSSYRAQVESACTGTSSSMKNLGQDQFGSFAFSSPPLVEQTGIADFLVIETDRIDTLVAKKRTLVERLKEKRTALISRTVTRGLPPDAARAAGLDPHPKLKPSGIDWLGDIPAHWSTSRIKYVAQIESGHTPSRSVEEYWVDCTIPWVSLNDSGYLREHDYISDTVYQISELGMANSSAHLLPAGAVVFSRDATVGLCAITTRPMAVSQHFIAYLCGPKLVPTYLLLSLKAMSQHLERLSMGATIPTIGMTDVRSLACPVPPVPEQKAIVDFVNFETARLDQLIAKVESVIDRLQEYRTALITAAVTGKIDVRRASASE